MPEEVRPHVVEVVLQGRPTWELDARQDVGKAIGTFQIKDEAGILLANPYVVFKADVVLLDPRTIFHEFQHARQHLTCELPAEELNDSKYEMAGAEWRAKQAEADFL
jgi:hypothetical protein